MNGLNARILIADPDPDVGQTLKLYFEAGNHEVQLLESGGDLVSGARQWQPNAILLSTEMTDQDPYRVCEQLLADTLTGHIPIIMMLHLADRQTRLKALEVGADDVVTKPIDIEELRLRVESAIRLSTFRVQV